jgi:hypothetical protein
VIARIGADGAITVRHVERRRVDHRPVSEEVTWSPAGTIDDAGVLRAAGGQIDVRIVDGRIVGLPPGLVIDLELADPDQARDVLFLLVGILGASESTSEVSGGAKPAP